jgi:hypothetical protein
MTVKTILANERSNVTTAELGAPFGLQANDRKGSGKVEAA